MATIAIAAPHTAGFGPRVHLGHLDAMRGFAILSVMVFHASVLVVRTAPGFIPWGMGPASQGAGGVQFFYMLSAFTLLLSAERGRTERSPLRDFYLRRFFRIAPLFYLAMLLNVLTGRWLESQPVTWVNALLGLFFLHGFRPSAINSVVLFGWSIAVEMTFYAMFPWLRKWLRALRWSVPAFVVAAAGCGWLSHLLATRATGTNEIFYFGAFWFPLQFPVFLLGMVTYQVHRDLLSGRVTASGKRQKQAISAALLAAAVALMAARSFTAHFPAYTFSLALAPFLLALCVWPWGALVNRFTVLIGKLSFSLYLLHAFVFAALQLALTQLNHAHAGAATTLMQAHPYLTLPVLSAMILLGTLPLALLTQRWVETPGIRLGTRVIAKLEGATP